MARAAAALAMLALSGRALGRNETRFAHFMRRAASRGELVRVIHGSGRVPADDSRRMMQPYCDAQDRGGKLVQIDAAGTSSSRFHDETARIARELNLEFERLPSLSGDSCPQFVADAEYVRKIEEAAGVWFSGGHPGRVTSCLFGHRATSHGINLAPEDITPVVRALWAHPLVGGISAGAMMQPSAAMYTGAEITQGNAHSAQIMRIGENLMNNHGMSFVKDKFTIHSHFSERGYQGMLPIAIVQRTDGLALAAGFDEGGVGHYFEATGEVYTVGVVEQGSGIVVYSDCAGDTDRQECRLHFMSDGDVWNPRTGEFTIDEDKVPCTGSKEAPAGSECVFAAGTAEGQNYRRISKQAAGTAVGTTVDNYHTPPSGETVQASFTTIPETRAWCNATGTVVSFTNLRLSQVRSAKSRKRRCAAEKHYTDY